MKTPLLVLSSLVLLATLIFLTIGPPDSTPRPVEEQQTHSPPAGTGNQFVGVSQDERDEGGVARVPPAPFNADETSDAQPEPENSPAPPPFVAEEITLHMGEDFRLGSHSNTVVKDGLRLGEENLAPRGAPAGQRFGVYVSPEQESIDGFDVLVAEAEAVIPEGGDVVFEFRTRVADDAWSSWQRLEPNEMTEPLGIGVPASAWQYRLTLFASGPEQSPVVHSIAFATRPPLTEAEVLPFSGAENSDPQ